jgi:heme exporter protein A
VSVTASLAGVTRRYGERDALAGVNLALEAGRRVALVGPNGAGKTTLLRVLALLARPNEGKVHLLGQDAARAGVTLRGAVGYAGHRTLLYDDLTVRQNLEYYARLYRLERPVARVDELLAWAGLGARADERARGLSRGLQQRLSLARAVLHRPRLLLLDEPDAALDSDGLSRLEALMGEQAVAGVAVLFATHRLDWALAASERAVVLAQGRVALDAESDSVAASEWPGRYARAVAGGGAAP